MTHPQELKDKIIDLLLSYIDEVEQDILTGIDEGIYHPDDNKKRLSQFDEERNMVKQFKDYTPGIYVYVEGGNIQGISGTEPISVDIFDKDNYQDGDDQEEFIENFGTPDEWSEMIDKKTKSGEIIGIY